MITSETSPSDLAYLLGTSHSKLSYVAYGVGVSNLYEIFQIPKKNGEMRLIRAPLPQLKNLQQRLKTHLEGLYSPHDAASAFIYGRGIVFNAQKHLKKKLVFNIDLENFYHSINFGRVRGLLMAKPYSLKEDTATLIAHICCVDKVLPQGAPTSPLISNMICRRLDRQLSHLARINRCTYSRYADDITFSSHLATDNQIFEVEKPTEPGRALIDLIESNGFSINLAKTRLQSNFQRQVVTGLKVNRIVNVDRRYIRTTKAMIHSLSFGAEKANEIHQLKNGENAASFESTVFGRINFIGMVKGVESSVYLTLATKFNNLDISRKANLSPKKENRNLEEKLHFYGFKNRRQLEKSVWVVSFEEVPGLNLDQQLIQATAFMCEGQRMFTASHVFEKAGNPTECIVYRIIEPNRKYKAVIVRRSAVSDIAELQIESEETIDFPSLRLAPDLDPNQGYRLSLIGFPQLRTGHDSLSIVPCTVINSFTRSTFRHGEINAEIRSGNSGGPLVNAYMQVVGMAVIGAARIIDGQHTDREGSNAYISAKHFAVPE